MIFELFRIDCQSYFSPDNRIRCTNLYQLEEESARERERESERERERERQRERDRERERVIARKKIDTVNRK